MKNNLNLLNLINMRDVPIEPVQWLWYPYIPIGKLTMVQGDPGDGKTTFVLAVIAALTKGEPLPECSSITEPMNVIYQTAEDGLSDTIKPRLVNTGADCSRVLVIDESHGELSLCDERLEPVSYTHLDVYKRQAKSSPRLSSEKTYLPEHTRYHRPSPGHSSWRSSPHPSH